MRRSIRRRASSRIHYALVQTLEARRLLASAAISNNVLTITGNDTADTITLTGPNASSQVSVTINGSSQNFALANFTSIRVDANGGNDTVNLTALTATNRPATIKGGAGNDSLVGGASNDLIDGGAGGDTIKGGAGRDTADYSSRTANVTVGLGTVSDDGEAGEKDNVATDIETVLGGSGNDVISAANAGTTANLLVGNGGNDSLSGGGGNDTLSGNAGTDTLNGNDGTDTATTAAGDTLISIENPPSAGDGTITVTFDGILKITGTDNAEIISIAPGANDTWVVKLGAQTKTFSTLDFSVVQIDARGGNDNVNLSLVNFDFLFTTILGGAGNDSILGGAEPDLIDGGTGADTMKGGDGVDAVTYSSRTNSVHVGLGTLNDDGEAGEKDNAFNDIEIILGGAGNDTLRGTNNFNTIRGNGGNDFIEGLDGGDELSGGAGNDTIDGGHGSDAIDGGDGDDLLYGARLIDEGFEGDDVLEGGNGNDTLRGDDGHDLLFGGADNDLLEGESGPDSLDGGTGNDSLNGGDDNDTLDGGEGGQGTDTLNGGSDFDRGVHTTGDTVISVEEIDDGTQPSAAIEQGTLVIRGTANADNLGLTGIDGRVDVYLETFAFPTVSFDVDDFSAVRIEGLGANDQISFKEPGNLGYPVTIDGGSGNDLMAIYSASVVVSVVGGEGNDTLGVDFQDESFGHSVDPIFNGGAGVDFYEDGDGSNGTVNLHPTVENAEIVSGNLVGNDLANQLQINTHGHIDGGGGNDTITTGFDDFSGSEITGGTGNDTIIARGANQLINGGIGNDVIRFERLPAVDVVVHGDQGNDTADFSALTVGVTVRLGEPVDGQPFYDDDIETVLGSSGADFITGSVLTVDNLFHGNGGNDTLRGGGGNDSIFGDAGLDAIEGNAGKDVLHGGDANDRIFGGSGADQLFGDGGDDLLQGQADADFLDGGPGTNDKGYNDNVDTLTNIEVVL